MALEFLLGEVHIVQKPGRCEAAAHECQGHHEDLECLHLERAAEKVNRGKSEMSYHKSDEKVAGWLERERNWADIAVCQMAGVPQDYTSPKSATNCLCRGTLSFQRYPGEAGTTIIVSCLPPNSSP
jgi:hypothetical protein